MPETETLHNLRAKWVVDPTSQPSVANVLLPQYGTPPFSAPNVPDAIYLTFGHMNPVLFDLEPGTVPTQEDVDGTVIPVVPVAQLVVTVDRLRDFVGQLQQVLGQFDENAQGE